MTKSATATADERTTLRVLARAAVYRVLSQSLAFPTAEALAELQREDLPRAADLAPHLPARVTAALETFAAPALDVDAETLAAKHRRVFSHVMATDCPPNETVYTTQQIFQETQELGDLSGFYRAFSLELAARERPDHITVELEFMHLLAFKEAYARQHHTREQVRLCRDAQRAFLRDHLGRWSPQFALLLRRKAGDGYYAEAARLLDALLGVENSRLRVRPEPVITLPDLSQRAGPDESGCPIADVCAVPEEGVAHVRVHPS